MRGSTLRRRRSQRVHVALAGACLAVCSPAFTHAASRYYVGPASSNWNVASNWSTIEGGGGTSGVPVPNDSVYIRGAASHDVTLDLSYATVLARLELGSTSASGAINSLTINAGFNLRETNGYVGYDGIGAMTQSAGSHTVSQALVLGNNAGATGTYSLSGTGRLSVIGNTASYVGFAGTGIFNQTGGTHSDDSVGLVLAGQTGSVGNYNLSGGLFSNNKLTVGQQGTATFTQSGGSVSLGSIEVAGAVGGSGRYDLIAGTLAPGSVYVAGSTSIVGAGGNATFNQSGGTHTISDSLRVGYEGPGRYTLSGGTLSGKYLNVTTTGIFESAGPAGVTMTMTQGIDLDGTLNIPASAPITLTGADGVFDLGHGILANTTGLTISSASNLVVIFPAGFNPATQLAGYSNPNGITAFAGSPITIANTKAVVAAAASISEFVNVQGTLRHGSSGAPLDLLGGVAVSGTGQATLSTLRTDNGVTSSLSDSATLSLTTGSNYVGYNATGSFNQTGGTHSAGLLVLGYNAGATGIYTLSAGSTAAPTTHIGQSGTGVFNQSGGSVFIERGLYLGTNAGASGSYTLSGSGVLTVVSTAESIGNSGAGTFTQNGGTHTVSATNVQLAVFGSGNGTYNLNAGTFNISGSFYAGAKGTGVLNINSGAMTIGTLLTTGFGPGCAIHWNGGSLSVPTVTLAHGGTMSMAPGANKVLKVNAISIVTADHSRLDLGDNKLITKDAVGTYSGSAYTGITGLIQIGRNGNAAPLWDGDGIITSQSHATAGNYTAIGVARGSEVRSATVSTTALWAGQTITGTDTLVMYTYGGDSNLDGKINVDDYVRIDSGSAGALKGWSNGDFNYDGKVNIDDYTIIDANVTTQGAAFVTAMGGDGQVSVTAVPEPAALALISLSVALSVRRRRRSSQACSASSHLSC